MKNTHEEVLETFKTSLPKDYYFSIKDVIDFVISEKISAEQAKRYITDYQAISRAKLQFHEKWISLTNMKNIAQYDQEEIAMLDKLLKALQ